MFEETIAKTFGYSILKESVPTFVTPTPIELGRLTALTFLKWIKENPQGVISLPTGKTPEYFIKFLHYFKKNWKESGAEDILGFLDFPDTKQLHFVQIDEFYPFEIQHDKSFARYIDEYYLSFLELDPKNVLKMTISNQGVLAKHGISKVFPNGKASLDILNTSPKNEVQELQLVAIKEMLEFCEAYEKKIDEWGGIGFFLGGVGYDGHIAFNVRGSTFDSKTRLITLNYETAAQSSGDLGGLENARDKSAITIGLDTITRKKDALIIVMAAGSEKGPVIQKTLEIEPSSQVPASILQTCSNARLFVTQETANSLSVVIKQKLNQKDPQTIMQHVFQYAFSSKTKLKDLKYAQVGLDMISKEEFDSLIAQWIQHLTNMLKPFDYKKHKTILHTNPHHDDDFLSYGTMIHRLFESSNHFAYLTSGFTSVSNKFMLSQLEIMSRIEWQDAFVFDTSRESYEKLILDFCKGENVNVEILAYNIIKECKCTNKQEFIDKVDWMIKYFATHLPGSKDDSLIQTIKGAMRESECDRLWKWNGIDFDHVKHLRLAFYGGEVWNPLPKIEQDVVPMIKLMESLNPDLITVAFDPLSTGPDTHYKVLQIVGEAVRMSPKEYEPMIWGYRNVWFRFDLSDSNLIAFQVNDVELEKMNSEFLNCFITQKNAEYPSWQFDGPFSKLSEAIQRQQFEMFATLLGREFLDEKTTGIVLIKSMNRSEFLTSVTSLKNKFIV